MMGSNMQRQAVPLIKPEVPIVGTGWKDKAAVMQGSRYMLMVMVLLNLLMPNEIMFVIRRNETHRL
jgi:DNA-directed RNA polymerase subunit beta